MKFHLVDRIESLEPGKRIVAIKALSLAEEYLADHFPAFPVMPGVLMVEALVQTGAWLVREAQDYAKSIIVLGVARNVRYASFVQPGQVLRCEVEATEITDTSAKIRGAGFVGEQQTVSGRFELRCFNLADRDASLASADENVVRGLRDRFRLIHGPEAIQAIGARP